MTSEGGLIKKGENNSCSQEKEREIKNKMKNKQGCIVQREKEKYISKKIKKSGRKESGVFDGRDLGQLADVSRARPYYTSSVNLLRDIKISANNLTQLNIYIYIFLYIYYFFNFLSSIESYVVITITLCVIHHT